MNQIMSWFAGKLAPGMQKIFSSPWVGTITSAMQKVLPLILVGSIVSIYSVLVRYIPPLPNMNFVNTFSFEMMSLIVFFMVAYFGMVELNHPKCTITTGLTSLTASLMALCPTMATLVKNAATGKTELTITDINSLGGSGLFIAIIVALIVMIIFHFYAKPHVLENSTSMPDFVCEQINNIVPVTLTCLVFGITVFALGFNLVGFINMVLQPIVDIGQSLPGFVIICFLYVLLYSVSTSTWSLDAIVKPVLMAGIATNAKLALAGGQPIHIVTTETILTAALIAIGGLGGALPLNFLMLFKYRSKKLKAMGKICLAPSVFDINELLVYGTPIVFNPLLMIPVQMNSVVGALVIWFIMRAGFLNIPAGMSNIPHIPALICTWLTTDDYRAFFWFFILFAIYALAWYLFLMKYDKQLVKEERKKKTVKRPLQEWGVFMDENNRLTPVSMSIIIHAGNARARANEALNDIASFNFRRAEEKIREARKDITKAHQGQTKIIQAEAADEQYTSCLLSTHAQGTPMTIMSEVNLTEKMITIFENFYTGRGTVK